MRTAAGLQTDSNSVIACTAPMFQGETQHELSCCSVSLIAVTQLSYYSDASHLVQFGVLFSSCKPAND